MLGIQLERWREEVAILRSETYNRGVSGIIPPALDGTISLSGTQPCEEYAGGVQLQDNKSNLLFSVF